MAHRHQPALFDVEPKPRAAPRKLMHVNDAGPFGEDEDMVRFLCRLCGYHSDWMTMKPSEAKRGIPCPRCNGK